MKVITSIQISNPMKISTTVTLEDDYGIRTAKLPAGMTAEISPIKGNPQLKTSRGHVTAKVVHVAAVRLGLDEL